MRNWIKIKKIFLDHKVAIILAILTAIIVALPQMYFRIDHKILKQDGIYQGIELIPDSPWSPRAKEFQDGNSGFGSIYYKDGKNDPYLFQPLPPMVVGYMGKIFSLDINNTLLLSRLVLSFLVFLLLYYFVYLVSKSKLIALSSAALLLLADSALSYFGIVQLLHGVSPDPFLRLARPVNPLMIYLLIFAFFIPFWLYYKEKLLKYGIISAIFLGLNFYNYFYSWTYMYAFGGVLVLIFLIRKDWKEAFRISGVFIGGILVAIPYIYNLYKASVHPAYIETGFRYGIIETHSPMFVGYFVIAGLLIFLLFFPKNKDKKQYLFSLAILLAPIVTLNQQILTGKALQASHYHWFLHKPFAVIFILITLFYFLSRKNLDRYKKMLAVSIIIPSFFIGFFVQVYSYHFGINDGGGVLIERQKYGPVMDWLNENTKKGNVVFANNEASHMVVIYTPLDVFYHRAGMYSLTATKERLSNIIFTFYRLRGVDAGDVRDIFLEERGYLSWNIYGMHYREFLGAYENIPDNKVEEIIKLYEDTLATSASDWINEQFKNYEVGYAIWDKKSDPEWELDKYEFLSEIAVFGDISVYRVNDKPKP